MPITLITNSCNSLRRSCTVLRSPAVIGKGKCSIQGGVNMDLTSYLAKTHHKLPPIGLKDSTEASRECNSLANNHANNDRNCFHQSKSINNHRYCVHGPEIKFSHFQFYVESLASCFTLHFLPLSFSRQFFSANLCFIYELATLYLSLSWCCCCFPGLVLLLVLLPLRNLNERLLKSKQQLWHHGGWK